MERKEKLVSLFSNHQTTVIGSQFHRNGRKSRNCLLNNCKSITSKSIGEREQDAGKSPLVVSLIVSLIVSLQGPRRGARVETLDSKS